MQLPIYLAQFLYTLCSGHMPNSANCRWDYGKGVRPFHNPICPLPFATRLKLVNISTYKHVCILCAMFSKLIFDSPRVYGMRVVLAAALVGV